MSHFSVLVIGDNVEEQLQPYHEFECTGEDDKYVQDIDVTAEEIKDFDPEDEDGQTPNHCLKFVYDESEIDTGEEHKYGYALVKDGKLVKAINRTNPNRKWDWWEVGGRWRNFLGGVVSAAKSEIDIEGLRSKAVVKAQEEWNKTEVILNSLGVKRDWLPWHHVRKVKFAGNIDAARDFYDSQDAVKAITKGMGLYFMDTPDKFLVTIDEYASSARDGAIVPFALLVNGEWISKGEMGWFGMSNDDLTQGDWNKKVNELIDSLPPETIITIVDCHI